MNNIVEYITVHKLSVKDIKRNNLFWGVVFVALIVCFTTILYGTEINDKKRWMVYAIFLCIIGLSMPLVYYIRYSDKNRKISDTIIYTKMRNVFIYQQLFGIYQILIFAFIYGINFIVVLFKDNTESFDIFLLLSVVLNLWFLNELCILCMNIIKRYYIALVLYMVICVFLLRVNNLSVGLFFPMNYENNCSTYFTGKIMELILVLLINKVWVKRNYNG